MADVAHMQQFFVCLKIPPKNILVCFKCPMIFWFGLITLGLCGVGAILGLLCSSRWSFTGSLAVAEIKL